MRARLLAELADDLRDSVLECYETTDEAPPRPDVRLVHGVVPPHDCTNDVLISYEVVQRAPQGNADQCVVVPQARFRVEVVRSYPATFDPEAMEIASTRLMGDATTLWYGLASRCAAGELFPSWPTLPCQAVKFEDMRPREPSGDRAGWSWRITVDLIGRPVA